MLIFKSGDIEVQATRYQMASFETVYDRVQKQYIKRFNGQLEADTSIEVVNFLNNNLDNNIDVVHDDSLALLNAKLVFVNTDLANNTCRIEIQQGLE